MAKREYSELTLKKLFGLSGNQCSFPGCTATMVDKDAAVMSNICHIEAVSEKGKRYNPNMSKAERNDYPNLILLCHKHHYEIDHNDNYTVEKLKAMKSEHEEKMRKLHTMEKSISKYPSLLTKVINVISNNDIDEFEDKQVKNVIKPQEKITYNDIKRYRATIEEYKVYQGKLNSIYIELENLDSFKKKNMFRKIRSLYLEALGLYFLGDHTIEKIRERSDDLIEYVENELVKIVDESLNKDEALDIETLTYGVKIIVVDSFIRCNILEEVIK
jgi:hypothetical protein